MILKISLADGEVTAIVPDADMDLSAENFIARYVELAIHCLLNSHASKSAAVEGVIQSTTAVEIPAVPVQMTFKAALIQMKSGLRVARAGWKDRWLEIDSKLLPHLADVVVPRDKSGTALSVSISSYAHTKEDCAARDWVVVA